MFVSRSLIQSWCLLAVEVFATNEVTKRMFEERARWTISHTLWSCMLGLTPFAILLVFFSCARIYQKAIPKPLKPKLHRVGRSTDLQSLASNREEKQETSKIGGNPVSEDPSLNRFKCDVIIEADVPAYINNNEYITFTAPVTDYLQ